MVYIVLEAKTPELEAFFDRFVLSFNRVLRASLEHHHKLGLRGSRPRASLGKHWRATDCVEGGGPRTRCALERIELLNLISRCK